MIPRKLILRLLQKAQATLEIQEAHSIPMPDLVRFLRAETKEEDSIFRAIAHDIEKQKVVPHLTQIDIMNAMLGVVRFTFQKRSKASSRFEVFTDESLDYPESVVLPLAFAQPFEEILQGTDLAPEFATLLKSLLISLDTQYATLEWGFDLHIPTKNHSNVLGKENIDDRIFVDFAPNELHIVGKYRGGSVAVSERMYADLSLIFALLEFERTIVSNRDDSRIRLAKLDNKPPRVMLSFSFTKNHHSVPLAYLKKDFEAHAVTFDIGNVNLLHPGLFHLLSNQFSRPVLKTAIYFFHSDRPRLPTSRFLQYWCAIEAMLGSPKEDIGKRLCHAFTLILPEKSEQDFLLLYNTRNDIVHKGVLTISREALNAVERIAQSIFYRLFGTVSHLAPI